MHMMLAAICIDFIFNFIRVTSSADLQPAVSQNPVRFGGQVRCTRQGASGFLTDINPNFGMIHY